MDYEGYAGICTHSGRIYSRAAPPVSAYSGLDTALAINAWRSSATLATSRCLAFRVDLVGCVDDCVTRGMRVRALGRTAPSRPVLGSRTGASTVTRP
jgi:hypothetical protein